MTAASRRFHGRPHRFLMLKVDELVAAHWNSGQLVPVGMTATALARNVTAGHPAQLTLGGNAPRVRTCMHIKDTAFSMEFLTSFLTHSHTPTHNRGDCRHAARRNLLHSPLLADHLISPSLRYSRRRTKAC